MPLYEYECTACHRRTEKIQKFSDPEITVCPFCNGPLERTLTAPAIQFKGSGWYKDLYSSPKPPAAAGSGEGASGSANVSGEGAAKSDPSSKSDAAPAATPAASPSSAPAAASSAGSSNS